MQTRQLIPAIWVYSVGESWNAARPKPYAAWLSDDEKARIERIRQARLLFDGQHRAYYLEEQRTQFDYPEARVLDRVTRPYLTYNVLGLIATKAADLLFGEAPMLTTAQGYDAQEAALQELADRVMLQPLLHQLAQDCNYEAECWIETIVADDGKVYLRQLPADEMFPASPLGPDNQYAVVKRLQLAEIGKSDARISLMLETTYRAGSIERHVYQVEHSDETRHEVALENWPGAKESGLTPITQTGIACSTVIWIPNLLVRGKAISDFDGAIDLQDAVNAKNTQLASVLAKHTDPMMSFPDSAVGADGNVRSDHKLFFHRDGSGPEGGPRYITWDPQADAAMRDRDFHVRALCIKTEMSPALLGLKEGAAPDEYRKLRLEAYNTEGRIQRKAAYWTAGIRRMLGVAQLLELTLPGYRYDLGPGMWGGIGVQLRDGLPVDPTDLANRQATLKSAGLISVRRALTEQLGDPKAVEAELAEIRSDAALAAPPIMGDYGPSGTPYPGQYDRSRDREDSANSADDSADSDASDGGEEMAA